MTRRNCHSNLQKYIQSKTSNRHTKDKDKIKPGPFLIKNIPFDIRLSGIIKIDNKIKFKRKYQQKIRRSQRLKDKANNNNKNINNSIFKIKCDHINKCFINIKRL